MAAINKILSTDQSLKDIIFRPSKQGFNIFIKSTKAQLTLITPSISSPFGIESMGGYLDKNIINIEIPKNKNNEMHNFNAEMTNIDNFFKHIEKNTKFLEYELPDDLLEMIKEKTYIPFVKPRKTQSGSSKLLRLFPKKNGRIMTMTFKENNGEPFNGTSIKGIKGTYKIRLGTLWITGDNYGLTWFADEFIRS